VLLEILGEVITYCWVLHIAPIHFSFTKSNLQHLCLLKHLAIHSTLRLVLKSLVSLNSFSSAFLSSCSLWITSPQDHLFDYWWFIVVCIFFISGWVSSAAFPTTASILLIPAAGELSMNNLNNSIFFLCTQHEVHHKVHNWINLHQKVIQLQITSISSQQLMAPFFSRASQLVHLVPLWEEYSLVFRIYLSFKLFLVGWSSLLLTERNQKS